MFISSTSPTLSQQSSRHSRFSAFFAVVDDSNTDDSDSKKPTKFYPHPVASLKDPSRLHSDVGKKSRKKTVRCGSGVIVIKF